MTQIYADSPSRLRCGFVGLQRSGGLSDEMERGDRHDFPRHRVAIRGWVLDFEAYPKSEKARAQSSFPMIGIYPAQAAWAGESVTIVRSRSMGRQPTMGT